MEYIGKNRRFLMGKKMLCMLLVLFLTLSGVGCTLAKEGAEKPQKDRLIGALITRTPIEKTYATVEGIVGGAKGTHPYAVDFESVEGVFLYFYEYRFDEDENSFYWPVGRGLNAKDNFIEEDGKRIAEVTGTGYFMPRVGTEVNEFYMNPIYQTADRQIYAVSGHSVSIGVGMNSPGTSCSLKVEEKETRTLIDQTEVDQTTIEVTLQAVYEPVSIMIYQMSADDKIIKEEKYDPETSKMELKMEPETEYVLLETEQMLPTGETITQREIYNWDGEETVDLLDDEGNEVTHPMTEIVTYYSVGDGFLVKDYGWLIWE